MLENKVRELEFQKTRLEREKTSLEGDLAAYLKEIAGLKSSVAELSAAEAGIKATLEVTQRRERESQEQVVSLTTEVNRSHSQIEDLKVSF